MTDGQPAGRVEDAGGQGQNAPLHQVALVKPVQIHGAHGALIHKQHLDRETERERESHLIRDVPGRCHTQTHGRG